MNTSIHATSPHYAMTFSISNFNSRFLLADANDLSDPTNSFFQLKNGSHLWYAITITSHPAGISLAPADPSGDLLATTFFDTFPLLPPVQILPFDQQDNAYPYEIIKLQASFYGPDQRLQLLLSPTDPHAVILDILNLLLNLLGQHTTTVSIGLLAPGVLAEILALALTMKDFQALSKSYTEALQTAATTYKVQEYAHQCSVNLEVLFNNPEEQDILANILWKMQGKAISRGRILTTIRQFSTLPFSLPLTASISNTIVALSSTLLQHAMPSVILQTTSTATPTPRPTPTPIPTARPTTNPTPVMTPRPATKITSTTNITCKANNACITTDTTCSITIISSVTKTVCTTRVTPAPNIPPIHPPVTTRTPKKATVIHKAKTSKNRHTSAQPMHKPTHTQLEHKHTFKQTPISTPFPIPTPNLSVGKP